MLSHDQPSNILTRACIGLFCCCFSPSVAIAICTAASVASSPSSPHNIQPPLATAAAGDAGAAAAGSCCKFASHTVLLKAFPMDSKTSKAMPSQTYIREAPTPRINL
jgi:hypothetical protein